MVVGVDSSIRIPSRYHTKGHGSCQYVKFWPNITENLRLKRSDPKVTLG